MRKKNFIRFVNAMKMTVMVYANFAVFAARMKMKKIPKNPTGNSTEKICFSPFWNTAAFNKLFT